ncbi:hypothetical protein ES708_22966 [subsurface metagenome]
MSEKRLSILPEVPTLKEKGYDVVFGTWRGVAVKKGTDPEIIKTLEELFYKATDTTCPIISDGLDIKTSITPPKAATITSPPL